MYKGAVARRPSYWMLIIIVVGWLIALFGVSLLRFHGLPRTNAGLDFWQIVSGGVGFALLGAVSGWFTLWLARRQDLRQVRIGTLLGYILAAPVAFVSGLLGPLAFEVFAPVHLPQWVTYLALFPVGVLLAGMVPLVVGAALGFALGSAVARR